MARWLEYPFSPIANGAVLLNLCMTWCSIGAIGIRQICRSNLIENTCNSAHSPPMDEDQPCYIIVKSFQSFSVPYPLSVAAGTLPASVRIPRYFHCRRTASDVVPTNNFSKFPLAPFIWQWVIFFLQLQLFNCNFIHLRQTIPCLKLKMLRNMVPKRHSTRATSFGGVSLAVRGTWNKGTSVVCLRMLGDSTTLFPFWD